MGCVAVRPGPKFSPRWSRPRRNRGDWIVTVGIVDDQWVSRCNRQDLGQSWHQVEQGGFFEGGIVTTATNGSPSVAFFGNARLTLTTRLDPPGDGGGKYL